MTKTRIAIHGACGRMGQRLVALATADPQLAVAAALERPDHPQLGDDAGQVAGAGSIGVPIAAELSVPADVAIDFSVPEALDQSLALCLEHSRPLVLATTGLDASQERRVREAAAQIPIVWAPNMSLAVNLAMKLTEVTAAALNNHPSAVDVEILERHHRFKEDAPSGTALEFGRRIAEKMGQSDHQHGRHGRPGPRPAEEIGYHAIRVGDNPGEHTIVFGLLGETIEVRVAATSRDCYAHGALCAAKFVVRQQPGLYSMTDVLGL